MQLIYKPRSANASGKLVYATPKGCIELIENTPLILTKNQLEWLNEKYEDLTHSIEIKEILVIEEEEEENINYLIEAGGVEELPEV